MAATDSAPAQPASRWLALALAGGALTAIALLLVFDPNAAGNPLPPCPSQWLTGLYCPGCGATRMLHALIHGDLPTALAMNPLLLLALALLPFLLLEPLGFAPESWKPALRRLGDARPWAVVVIAYAITRNLPWWPFSWLAPG